MNKQPIFLLVIMLAIVSVSLGQSDVIPIAELRFRGLMGGVQNGKWVAPAKAAPAMKPETEFVLVGWNGVEEGGVTLGKKGEQEDVCRDFTRMEFEL